MSHPPLPPGLENSANDSKGQSTNGAFSQENILGENHDSTEDTGVANAGPVAAGWHEEETEKPLVEGYCVEREGMSKQPVTLTWILMDSKPLCL